MSKSLKRVTAAIAAAGLENTIVHLSGAATTAQMAADELGTHPDQIAKSIIFLGEAQGRALLFLTAGGRRVDPDRAAEIAGEPLAKADAALIRAQTGFAIGGVSPLGHLSPIRAFADPYLMTFDLIWAAAGTPHHVFSLTPAALIRVTGAEIADFAHST